MSKRYVLLGLMLVSLTWLAAQTLASTCDNGLVTGEYSRFTHGNSPFDVLEWVYRESTIVGLTRTAAVATPDGNIHVVCCNTMLPETSYSHEQIYVPALDSWYVGSLTHPAGTAGVHNHDAKVLGNKIYVGGGSSRSTFYSNLTIIDLEANTWTDAGAMPITDIYYYEFAAGSDGKLYMFGGDLPYNYTYAYDTTTHTWTSRAAMPIALRDPAACCVGDTIYLFGGFTDAAGTTPTNAVRAYSITGNNWASKTNMPTARGWATASAVYSDSGPMIYVCAGLTASSVVGTVERYDVTRGTWATQTTLQTIRRSHAAVVLGDSVFVCCGWRAARPMPFIAAVERGYDPIQVAVGENPEQSTNRDSPYFRPNPCGAQTMVRFSDSHPVEARLFDAAGNRRLRFLLRPGDNLLQTGKLEAGVYWLCLWENRDSPYRQRGQSRVSEAEIPGQSPSRSGFPAH